MNKLNWDNLAKEERSNYMRLQMSPSGGYDRSGYYDCGECGACGRQMLGSGWCESCYEEWKRLDNKLRGDRG